MAEETKDESGFKVVDKRALKEDGTRREEASREEVGHPVPPAPPRPSPPRPAKAHEEPEPEEYFEEVATGFDTLVSYLSTTAMFQLGLLPGPGGERIPSDLVNARRTIDLLEVLQQKTLGNLTPDEARLLEEVLYELRLSYVEMEKRAAKNIR